MIDDVTVERELEAWLLDGPETAPGTVLSGVLVAFPRIERHGRRHGPRAIRGRRWSRAAAIVLAAALAVPAFALLTLVPGSSPGTSTRTRPRISSRVRW